MSERVVYPKTQAEDWAKIYKINIESDPCKSCGLMLTANIPFAVDGWRGFTSSPHECGEGFDLVVAVPASESKRAELKNAFKVISEEIE